MILAKQRKMSLQDYLDYDDGTDKHYELVDGVLVEMGAENPINPAIASFLVSKSLKIATLRQRKPPNS